MRLLRLLVTLLALLAAPAVAQTPADAIESDWRAIPDGEVLVMTLDGGRQVFIRLAPRYAPVHVANIRKLALAKWWDGTSVYRVQENYVAQWGGGDGRRGPPQTQTGLPAQVIPRPPSEYEWPTYDAVTALTRRDPYAPKSGHSADGWPLASDGHSAWMTHCYGMVGVARGMAPETGSGSELYAVIGHSPRHLDRNIALVGRVIEGMPWLSTLTRGTGNMGFYTPAETPTVLVSIRLASQLPVGERPRFQYRSTDNPRFAAWIGGRENREPPFFTVPAGGADICNVEVAVRRTP